MRAPTGIIVNALKKLNEQFSFYNARTSINALKYTLAQYSML
jgi:hypothetical protein